VERIRENGNHGKKSGKDERKQRIKVGISPQGCVQHGKRVAKRGQSYRDGKWGKEKPVALTETGMARA